MVLETKWKVLIGISAIASGIYVAVSLYKWWQSKAQLRKESKGEVDPEIGQEVEQVQIGADSQPPEVIQGISPLSPQTGEEFVSLMNDAINALQIDQVILFANSVIPPQLDNNLWLDRAATEAVTGGGIAALPLGQKESYYVETVKVVMSRTFRQGINTPVRTVRINMVMIRETENYLIRVFNVTSVERIAMSLFEDFRLTADEWYLHNIAQVNHITQGGIML